MRTGYKIDRFYDASDSYRTTLTITQRIGGCFPLETATGNLFAVAPDIGTFETPVRIAYRNLSGDGSRSRHRRSILFCDCDNSLRVGVDMDGSELGNF